jgi:hypothetical protein
VTGDGKANGTCIHPTDEEQASKEAAWTALAEEARTTASPTGEPLILDIPLLKPEQAAIEAEKVKHLRDHWISRGEGTFWTIGASTYNDLIVSDGHATYYQVAEQVNPMIEGAFGPLLGLTRSVIGKIYNRECIDLPFAGLMGFHIFDSSGDDRREEGSNIHTDEPFQRLLWTEPFSKPFSFTVALELPDGDGGLDYWVDGEQYRRYLPYETGHMYLHTGRFPHRIAAPTWPSNEKPRITLQGHGAILEDTNRVAVYF